MDFSTILDKIDIQAILAKITDILSKIDVTEILNKIIDLVMGFINKG